jgi:AGCS family alanine or glycine:cation symporter
MTGLVLVISDAWIVSKAHKITGAALTAYTFKGALGTFGTWVVGFGLVFFAYSTIIAWSYYGDRSAEYMFGEKAILPYRLIYVILIVLGASTKPQLIWNLADTANIFMALPNLISLTLLAVVTKKLTDKYFTDYKKYF